MGKRNNSKKSTGVKVNPEQKQMLAAAQAATVEKTEETVAANENEPVTSETVQTAGGDDVTVTGNATAAEAKDVPVAPQKDNRTQKERRNDRLALREKALAEALEKNLPFFEGYPAAKFEEDYAKAFADATSCEKAIPADAIRAAKAKLAESIAAKSPTQELIEAAKASQLPTAEMDNTETMSKDAADLALMQKAEELDKSPVAVVAEGTVTLVSNDGEIVGEKEVGETTTVTYDGVEYTLDAKGDLLQLDGESSKKFGQRKHKFKCAKYAADKAAKAAAKAEALAEAEYEGRNGAPPSPSDINKNLPLDVDDEGNAVTATVTPPEKSAEESASILLDQSQPIASAEGSTNESPNNAPEQEQAKPLDTTVVPTPETTDTPAAAPVEEPITPVAAPVQEQDKQPVDTVGNEASIPAPKPKMTPKLVVDNEKDAAEDKKMAEKQSAEDRAAAKKFYGSTWTDERGTKLTQAHIWLNKAIEADRKLRDKIETEGPKNNRTVFRMAMNAALKFEAAAFGNTPEQITVEEITALFGPAPQAAKAA